MARGSSALIIMSTLMQRARNTILNGGRFHSLWQGRFTLLCAAANRPNLYLEGEWRHKVSERFVFVRTFPS